MLRPSPNHGTQRLPNDDDDDDQNSLTAFGTSLPADDDLMNSAIFNVLPRYTLLTMTFYINA